MKNNYIFTFVKFFLFLFLFCFLAEITRRFLYSGGALNVGVFIASIFSCFVCYTFVADLNPLYKNVQMFFFRTTFVSYLVPFILLIVGIGGFIIPKIFNVPLNENLFVFCGGFIFTAHMIYIASETKGNSFPEFINYLFLLSLLYIINIVFLGLYLNAAFKFKIFRVLVDGVAAGAELIQSIFLQMFS